MTQPRQLVWHELAPLEDRQDLLKVALQRRWGQSLIILGWLHLAAFSICWYLTWFKDFHEAGPYLTIWISEMIGIWIIFRSVGGARSGRPAVKPLERFIVKLWITYFILAFNLASMNTLRGHFMFEFFPAYASLGSFAFLVMSFVVHRDFFWPVPILFGSGLLMAANLYHAFLIFALSWWLILNGIGLRILKAGIKKSPDNPPASANTLPDGQVHPLEISVTLDQEIGVR
jgi:hypothetical protein